MVLFEPMYFVISTIATIAFVFYCALPGFMSMHTTNKERRRLAAIQAKKLRKEQRKK